MNADDRIINYMKARNQYAGTVACTVAVQLFALAVYLCIYALIAGGVFYSLSEGTGKVIALSVCGAVAAGLVIVNVLCVIKGRKVYITRPDSIAIRDSEEIVRLAYITARPVLIHKITWSIICLATTPLVYITFLIFMENQELASTYAKIVICLMAAFAFLYGYPCLDRIACYRALLGETHELYYDSGSNAGRGYVISFAIPVSVVVWYGLRYYGNSGDIAWIVFPATALFALAVIFLIGWTNGVTGKKAGDEL